MKRLLITAALVAVSWMPVAHSASVVNLGEISGLAPARFAFAGAFDFHSIAFEVTADGPYRFEIVDQNTGPGTFGGGVFTTDVMDKLGLDIKEDLGGGLFSGVLGTGGFDQPTTSSAFFTTNLEAGKRYVGLFVGLVEGGADFGEASLGISLVPIPPAAALLVSAIGGLLIVRRRRSSQASTA